MRDRFKTHAFAKVNTAQLYLITFYDKGKRKGDENSIGPMEVWPFVLTHVFLSDSFAADLYEAAKSSEPFVFKIVSFVMKSQ